MNTTLVRARKQLGIKSHISSPRIEDLDNNNVLESANGILRARYNLTKRLGNLESGRDIANGIRTILRPHSPLGKKLSGIGYANSETQKLPWLQNMKSISASTVDFTRVLSV